ncbi:uncharacterized protein C19orf18 homolog isoform 1-T1 [Thomomys bottae]
MCFIRSSLHWLTWFRQKGSTAATGADFTVMMIPPWNPNVLQEAKLLQIPGLQLNTSPVQGGTDHFRMEGKGQSSFTVLCLFLLECLLYLHWAYADDAQTSEYTTKFPVSDNTMDDTSEPTKNSRGFLAFSVAPRAGESWNAVIPRRPILAQVIFIACTSLSIALICGILVFYIIHLLVKKEESQQLAMLYENVEIPFLGDEKEGSEDDGLEESAYLLPENEKELGKFIGSVIRAKRRENSIKKKQRQQQLLPVQTVKSEIYSVAEENL